MSNKSIEIRSRSGRRRKREIRGKKRDRGRKMRRGNEHIQTNQLNRNSQDPYLLLSV
jgi:hypothetical protein